MELLKTKKMNNYYPRNFVAKRVGGGKLNNELILE